MSSEVLGEGVADDEQEPRAMQTQTSGEVPEGGAVDDERGPRGWHRRRTKSSREASTDEAHVISVKKVNETSQQKNELANATSQQKNELSNVTSQATHLFIYYWL